MKIVAMFFMIFGAALLANCICLCCFQCFVRRVFNVLETLAMAASGGGGGGGTGVVGGGSIVAVPPGNGNPTALVLVERNEVIQSSTGPAGPASDTGKINPPQSTTPRKGSRGQGSRASTAYSKPSAKDLAAAVKL